VIAEEEPMMVDGHVVSRRQFLSATGLGVASLGLAACGGSSASGGAAGSKKNAKSGPATITFTTWASAAEATAFKKLVPQFEQKNPKIKVKLDIVPYAQDLQDINSRLQAGDPPDAFRITYTDLGVYSSKQALLDLSPYTDSSFKSQFQPGYYAAIEFNGKPYGIPHQTDTTALVLNREVMKRAGVTSVPDSLSSAWSWDEFLAVAKKVQRVQPSGKYAFAYDWQQTGAFRWLTWLFEAGGNLLSSDLKSPAINSAAGKKALAFTQSFFTEKLVPPNTSTGNTVYPDTIFLSQTIGMAFAADFLLPGDIVTAKFDWDVTFQPRDVSASSDLGGNGIVGAAQTKSPEAVATFLQFLASREAMSTFCALTNELPTRNDLKAADIKWAVAGDKMKTFVDQATTLTPSQVQQVTVPAFGKINTALQNDLDACFTGHQSPDQTAASIAGSVTTALQQA
jgi:multiple sugar transport system substrate-binding protein